MPADAESDDPKTLTSGQVTEDDEWICDGCFVDFRDEFGWTVLEVGSG